MSVGEDPGLGWEIPTVTAGGSHRMVLLGLSRTYAPEIARLDFELNKTDRAALGIRPASFTRSYWAMRGENDYVVAVGRPPAGGQTWNYLAEWNGLAWIVEEDPIRWIGREVVGIAVGPDRIAVLTVMPGAVELWVRKTDWQSEVLTDIHYLTRPLLTANGTHLFVLGRNAIGSVAVSSKPWQFNEWTTTILQNQAAVLHGGTFQAASLESTAPILAWDPNAVPPTLEPESFATYVAVWEKGQWQVTKVVGDDRVPRAIGTSNAYTVIVAEKVLKPDKVQVWLRANSEGIWRICEGDYAFAAAGSMSTAETYLMLTQNFGDARLSPASPSHAGCPASDNGSPS